jgi:hypothetical protein
MLDKDIDTDSQINAEYIRRNNRAEDYDETYSESYVKWATNRNEQANIGLASLRPQRYNFGNHILKAMSCATTKIGVMFMEKNLPGSLTRKLYVNHRPGVVKAIWIVYAIQDSDNRKDERGLPLFHPGIAVLGGNSVADELSKCGHSIHPSQFCKKQIDANMNTIADFLSNQIVCEHCLVERDHLLDRRMYRHDKHKINSSEFIRYYIHNRCRHARYRTDVLGLELRDLQAKSMHTHTIFRGKTERIVLDLKFKDEYAELPWILAPVPKQNTLGDTLLCAMILHATEKLINSHDLCKFKEKMVRKLMDDYHSQLYNDKRNRQDWHLTLEKALDYNVTYDKLFGILFKQADNSKIRPSRDVNGITHFCEIDYDLTLAIEILSFYFKQTIHIVRAGEMYTLGVRGSEALAKELKADNQNVVCIYYHRDELYHVNTIETEHVDIDPKLRMLFCGDIPALDVPVKAYNTFSLLVYNDMDGTNTRLSKTGKQSFVKYSDVDALETTPQPGYISRVHHAHEINMMLNSNPHKAQYRYELITFNIWKRTNKTNHLSMQIGSLISSLGLDIGSFKRLIDAYIPPQMSTYISDRHREKRLLVQGRYN